jgi:hypothetical protein
MQGQLFVGPEAQMVESTIVLFLAFDIEMHAWLVRVSLIFPHDGFSTGDVGAEANTSIDEIAKLTIACGKWRAKCTPLRRLGEGIGPRTALPLHVMPMTRILRRTTQTGCICAGI